MADKDVDSKGDAGKDVDSKGDAGKDVDSKGGSDAQADLVDEIVSRASALGGWLIVSIVSPLPPNGRRFARPAAATSPSDALKEAAKRTAFEAAKRTAVEAVKRTASEAAKRTASEAMKRSRHPAVTEPAVQPDSYRKTNPGTAK
jgi:hypothetical protein